MHKFNVKLSFILLLLNMNSALAYASPDRLLHEPSKTEQSITLLFGILIYPSSG